MSFSLSKSELFIGFYSILLFASSLLLAEGEENDPYANYIKTSKDFQRVKQDKHWLHKAWPSWVYFCWYYKWSIGYGDEGGKFCQKYGYNGGMTYMGNPSHLKWFKKFNLRFYDSHTAGKGDLYLKGHPKSKIMGSERIRNPQINEALKTKLEGIIKRHVNNLKGSPLRTAYALDDEISWGSFSKPSMWKITDEDKYKTWLKEVYGEGNVPSHTAWIGYNSIRKKLGQWRVADFDCHQLMDQWAFNDSVWANFLGELVKYTNSIDPDTPVGFVGAQSPNSFGGFDYAKLMRKIQFLGAYGLDDTQTVVRSFNPGNAIPVVSTHFHQNVADTVWQTWYSLAHGNRGHIGWVQGWFDGATPKPWHKQVAVHYLEAGHKIAPLVSDAEWIEDKVALYYSQASIQMSWILDAAAHGRTWVNRNGDSKRGTYHLVNKAWRNMLRDEGIQFTDLSYVKLIRKGVPKKYKVLILPDVYCLSDAEAREIKKFCKNGGTVIGDFLTGVFDQHGKGRKKGGALDDMFGIKQDPNLTQNGAFTKGLWVEVNQDINWNSAGKDYKSFLTKANTSKKDASGFNIAVPSMGVNNVNRFGKGKAYFLNLSPQWYNAYRQSGDFNACQQRSIFMKPIHDAGIKRWVEIENAGQDSFGYEITYWKKGDRTILFLVTNPESVKSALGGGNSVGLKTSTLNVTLKFSKTRRGVKNERTGKNLGSGTSFNVEWVQNQAVVLSFDGSP